MWCIGVDNTYVGDLTQTEVLVESIWVCQVLVCIQTRITPMVHSIHQVHGMDFVDSLIFYCRLNNSTIQVYTI